MTAGGRPGSRVVSPTRAPSSHFTEWQPITDVNVMSYVRSAIAFLPLLLNQDSGHIINTRSDRTAFIDERGRTL